MFSVLKSLTQDQQMHCSELFVSHGFVIDMEMFAPSNSIVVIINPKCLMEK